MLHKGETLKTDSARLSTHASVQVSKAAMTSSHAASLLILREEQEAARRLASTTAARTTAISPVSPGQGGKLN